MLEWFQELQAPLKVNVSDEAVSKAEYFIYDCDTNYLTNLSNNGNSL